MIYRSAIFAIALAASTAAAADPLTIRVGESWAFTIAKGQPANAHRVKATAKPARGEIKATLTSLAGTTLTLTNNSSTAYTYRAELIGAAKAGGRTCTLPPDAVPSLEYWPQKAAAVRIDDFRAATDPGSCPPAN